MTKYHYKRVWVGRGVKPLGECPKCGERGYLSATWSARENTMTWCGPYFNVHHHKYTIDENGDVVSKHKETHYIGTDYRVDFPELRKIPPSIEWMQNYRLEKGYSSLPEYNYQKIRELKNIRGKIRSSLMNLTESELNDILSFIPSKSGAEITNNEGSK